MMVEEKENERERKDKGEKGKRKIEKWGKENRKHE